MQAATISLRLVRSPACSASRTSRSSRASIGTGRLRPTERSGQEGSDVSGGICSAIGGGNEEKRVLIICYSRKQALERAVHYGLMDPRPLTHHERTEARLRCQVDPLPQRHQNA